MNLNKLFTMQRILDERIVEEHQLHGKNLVNKKIVALQVEVGELANETRCFKFWSLKPPAEDQIILEEYVDGLHFILSIGNDLDYKVTEVGTIEENGVSVVDQFLQVFDSINQFWKEQTSESYERLFVNYVYLGSLLGFTKENIEEAYDEKNKVNHVRQDEGY
ncbi:dUTP diphosphatase [Anaerobacillus sp. MEB173]|uniref:dUTP diphosphatase n=1 Tax=Anaerobacillus sp. MEB173 TaxID=3383345 RepID=UPI003F931B72